MDIFKVLNAISKRKDEFIRKGMDESEALVKPFHIGRIPHSFA